MVYLDTMPLRFGHFRVLITTAMGQFLGAAVATLSGVLIPLLAIVQHHELDSVTQGLIASMELIGIMVGSFVIGKLADKDGYLPFLRLSSILVFIGALVVYVTGSIDLLIHSLFVMGFGILAIICSLIILWQPAVGALYVIYMLAFTFLIIGFFRVMLSFELKSLHKRSTVMNGK